MGGWSLALWSNGYRAASASAGANSALLAAVTGSPASKIRIKNSELDGGPVYQYRVSPSCGAFKMKEILIRSCSLYKDWTNENKNKWESTRQKGFSGL